MEEKYLEIYNILMEIDELSKVQFDRLISVYGYENVISVMKDVCLGNKINMNKFLDVSSSILLDDDENVEMSNFYYYFNDISIVDEIDTGYKDILFDEIIYIVDKLNELFKLAGCDNLKFNNRRYVWIADKYEYVLENCCDEVLKTEIIDLYNLFVDKRNYIASGYLKFVIMIARQVYKVYGLSIDELIQFGNIGLLKAIETYNYSYNIEFTTYSYNWIKQYIYSNSKKIMYQVRKPSHMYEYNNKRIKAINELSQKLGRNPSKREIAEYMNISLDKVKLIERAFYEPVSVDEEYDVSMGEFLINLKDLIVDDSVNVEDMVINQIIMSELNSIINDMLNAKDIRFLELKYINGLSNVDIASIMGVSRQRISQLDNKIIKKLRCNSKIREIKKSYIL